MSWAERRRHDLVQSHHLADYACPEDRQQAGVLVDHIIELEKLRHAVTMHGGDAADLERIEDAAWPVREVLRQLDEKNVGERRAHLAFT